MTTDNHMPLADAHEMLKECVRRLEHETRPVPPMHEFKNVASHVLSRYTRPEHAMREYVAARNMRDTLAALIYGDGATRHD